MKKYYYSLFAAASMMLAVTSCSQEEDFPQSSSEMTKFSISLDGATQSRIAGDGTTVDKLYYAVYDSETSKVVYPTTTKYGTAEKVNGSWTLDLPLMKSETYDILFWAQKDGSGAYTFDELTNITVNYDGVLSNKENRDAFFNALDNFTASGSEHTIVLRRPFAQLNVATTKTDWDKAVAIYNSNNNTTNVTPVSASAVTVSNQATNFNVLTGAATATPAEGISVTFEANSLIDESIKIKRMVEGEEKDVEYKLLAMNYLLPVVEKAPNGIKQYNASELDPTKDVVEVEFTLYKGENTEIVNVKVPATPIQRNYRTNIIGDLLTGEGFDIIIDDDFDGEENQEIEISADGIVKDANGIYHITKSEGLWALANLVNNGSQAASTGGRAATVGYTFEGETFVLDGDIDLQGAEWTPIGSNGAKFSGTFDGNGKTVSNFKVDVEEMGGLFGNVESATIKGLNVQTANIKSTHFAGGIAAHGVCAKITDCTVEGVTITVNPNVKIGNDFNGDKAGGIIGYLSHENGDTYVKKCTAKDVTIQAYRDFGGIVGYANGPSEVSACSVDNIVLTIDNTNNYKGYSSQDEYDAGAIVGEAHSSATVSNDTPAEDTYEIIYTAGTEYPGYYQDANGKYIVTEDKGITALIGNGQTEINLADGSFTMPINVDLREKALSFSGSKNAILDASNVDERNQFVTGANLSFEGITINFGTTNYMGFANTARLSYKDCAINGLQFFYGAGETTFENCDLNSNGAEHCAWTWGGQNISFTDCDFTYSDRAINCYGEGVSTNATFTNCTFTKIAGKDVTGAIETNSSTLTKLNLTINNCSVNEGELWWVSTWDSKDGENTVVTLDGNRIIATNGQLKAAVAEGLTEINLTEGTFGIPSEIAGKTITFNGMGDGTVFDFTKAYNVGDATITFKNLYIEGKNANVMNGYGIQHTTKTIKYENCTLNNHITSEFAGEVEYIGCTFTGMYYIATYSVKSAKFTNCIFDREDSRAVLVYSHGDNPCVVTLEGCTFKAKAKGYTGAGAWTAAVEIDTTNIPSEGTKVTITNCTADENYSGIVRDKSAAGKATAVIVVNGLTYVSEGVWKDAEGNYVVTNGNELNATIKAAVANSTIKLLAGTYEGVEMAGQIASSLTIQGTEDAIVKGIKCNFSNATLEGMTFKNVYFENKGIYFEEITGAPWDFVKNFTMTECVMTGIGNNQDVVGNRLFDLGTDSPGSNQFENIIIENCKVSNVIQGIRLGALRGACIIKGNEISNIGHNGITLRSVQEGTVLVEGNKISNGSDRAFRIGSNSGSVTYKNNTIVNCGDTVDGSNFKANTLGTVTFEGNTVDGNAWNPLS